MSEEQTLERTQRQIEKKIKFALLDRGMTQVELAKLISENPQQLNRAIKGDMSPKSLSLRQKIYKVLGMED